ncbi:hypothetical protein Syun_021420 [Stephania yunnanensis]|uniref:MADS-box domain-containing protein n=1 Tax=Stephania yunnanensis TaxID=152371 RepID=A0AAP0NPR0_9MAGN
MRVADHSRSRLLPRDGRNEEGDEPVNEQGEVRAWRHGFVQVVEAMRNSTSGGNEKCVKMRKKIQIQKIESSKLRQVCFAKRRKGLFKKCLKWSTLSGNDLLVVAFTPAGRPFTLCASSSSASPDSILNCSSLMIPSSPSDHEFPITPVDHGTTVLLTSSYFNSQIENPNSTRKDEEVEETRRKGLFKKCLKWSTLSGNDLLVVAFSLAGRPFTLCASSFGASTYSILNRLSPLIPSSSSDLEFPITPVDHGTTILLTSSYSNSRIENPNSTRTAEETRLNQEGFNTFSPSSSVEEYMNSDSFDFEIHEVLHSSELSSNYDMIYQEFFALMDTSVKPGNRLANAAEEEWLGWINDGF